jgi:hypothetical protein
MPISCIAFGAVTRYAPPGLRSYSAIPWYPYLAVHSGLVIASQICSGLALM